MSDEMPLGLYEQRPDIEYVLAVTERGYGKITPVDQWRIQQRGGKGVRLVETSERNGQLVGMTVVRLHHSVILVTSRGKQVRIPVITIRETGRVAQGVRLMNVDEGDSISAIALVDI
jgi:DNA gyrase subunit A